MIRRFLVLVTPVPNEADIITREEAMEGFAWLHQRLADGSLIVAEAYPETGGYMIVAAESAESIEGWLTDYPLRHTIDIEVHELVSLSAGFAVLLAAIDTYAKARA